MAFAPTPSPEAAHRAASVRVLDCDPAAREVLFRGAMRRLPRSERMMLRFTLLERRPGERWVGVPARALRRWKRSRSGVGRFAHRQRVRNLRDGFDYRARVDFRWLSRNGSVVRRAQLWSGVCPLSEPLPDLRVTALGAGDEGTGGRYTATVRNAGRAASAGTELRLTADGEPAGTAAVPALAVGESVELSLAGPRCRERASAVVDPAGAVGESDEANNRRTSACS